MKAVELKDGWHGWHVYHDDAWHLVDKADWFHDGTLTICPIGSELPFTVKPDETIAALSPAKWIMHLEAELAAFRTCALAARTSARLVRAIQPAR